MCFLWVALKGCARLWDSITSGNSLKIYLDDLLIHTVDCETHLEKMEEGESSVGTTLTALVQQISNHSGYPRWFMQSSSVVIIKDVGGALRGVAD